MSKLYVGRVLSSQTFSEKKVWTKKFEVGRSDMDVHTYISGIGRGVLRKNPAKIIANSVFCRKNGVILHLKVLPP